MVPLDIDTCFLCLSHSVLTVRFIDSYWPSKSGRTMTQALALGLGSMFNHSTRGQNVGWKRNTDTDVIVYTALRNIKAGEELCISYGSARLWFKDADAEAYDAKAAVLKAMFDENHAKYV